MMGAFLARLRAILASPGSQGAISNMATTMSPFDEFEIDRTEGLVDQADRAIQTDRSRKLRRMDRWLDWIVAASGSQPVFVIILISLALWALMGIRFGQSENWQVLISDVQAILCYAYDSFLMRQQLNSYNRKIRISASLRSRMTSVKRMLRQLTLNRIESEEEPLAKLWNNASEDSLPRETVTTRISTWACQILGHIATCFLFWVCIVIWLAFGPYCHWSNRWQLYINSATSALMVLIFAFLANIRELHEKYSEECFRQIDEVDARLEKALRIATGDTISNVEIQIRPPTISRLQRAIFYYADVIGTLVGVVLLIGILVAWIAIGPALHFNSNWWLIIGTYAGLIGMQDGIVLHNVQSQFHDREDEAFALVDYDDEDALNIVSMASPASSDANEQKSISARVSVWLGDLWAHEYTVVAGVALIIGLIIGATALKWTLTGQLVCNVPPSIIESYIMMALLTGHTISEKKGRRELNNLYQRRLILIDIVAGMTKEAKVDSESPAKGEKAIIATVEG